MNINDIQQAVPGFNTTLVVGGPCVVRVHEALDSVLQGQKSRYFISVDFKFRQFDALNLGQLGHLGCTKAEATREANELAHKIFVARTALNAAQEQALHWDTSTNRHTVKLQQERFDRLVSRYNTELEAA